MAIRQTKNTYRTIAGWITLGLGIITAAARRRRWRRSRAVEGPGFVSDQWLAEYRISHISDPDW